MLGFSYLLLVSKCVCHEFLGSCTNPQSRDHPLLFFSHSVLYSMVWSCWPYCLKITQCHHLPTIPLSFSVMVQSTWRRSRSCSPMPPYPPLPTLWTVAPSLSQGFSCDWPSQGTIADRVMEGLDSQRVWALRPLVLLGFCDFYPRNRPTHGVRHGSVSLITSHLLDPPLALSNFFMIQPERFWFWWC